jgi:hypothetical protein
MHSILFGQVVLVVLESSLEDAAIFATTFSATAMSCGIEYLPSTSLGCVLAVVVSLGFILPLSTIDLEINADAGIICMCFLES